mmetsp:Transcript_33161/g.103354  ORF Transcript_33161/g.103354 Transcript_33161/m.103354 type:complete len:375 (-) Transcript_33161:59-1183(-)
MLTRLMRIVRILRMHGPLYAYVKVLLSMLNTYIWILSLIFILCFTMAIAITSLVGHRVLAHYDDEEVAAQISEHFADVPKALFTCFQLVTLEGWSKVQNAVISSSPGFRAFFLFYIVFMSWIMLSLLTAVASETMISASSTKKEQQAMEQELQRHNFASFLAEEFVKADNDGNRVLDKEEFANLMSQPQLKQLMKAHEINLDESELGRVWDTFDIDESGELTIDELVAGFSYMQENLAMKHVANVVYSLKHFGMKMDENTDILQQSVEELARRQKHGLKVVTRDLAWREKRWMAFHTEAMEELLDTSEPSQVLDHSERSFSPEKQPRSVQGSWTGQGLSKLTGRRKGTPQGNKANRASQSVNNKPAPPAIRTGA